jgi:hypothetical protein
MMQAHEPDDVYYQEIEKASQPRFHDRWYRYLLRDFNELYRERGETDLMPIEQNQGGFFHNWTKILHAKTVKASKVCPLATQTIVIHRLSRGLIKLTVEGSLSSMRSSAKPR